MAQLESMGGLNGIALPEQFAGILQGMPRLVSSANISFRKLFANELQRAFAATLLAGLPERFDIG